MVRLKANLLVLTVVASTPFQFQNGAIKSIFPKVLPPSENMFQFQNGAIKRAHVEKHGGD